MSIQAFFLRQSLRPIKLMLTYVSIEQMRKMSARGGKKPKLVGARLESVTANGVPCEWVIPDEVQGDEIILYLHGGGFIFGWYEAHMKMVAEIAKTCKLKALCVDYRLAPEYPFPAALDDCVQAYLWLVEKGTPPEKIIVMGDSAGGNLTITTMLALREARERLPLAGVCLSPVIDLEGTGDSVAVVNDPILSRKGTDKMTGAYIGNNDPKNPLISPYYADLHGLPPLLIQVGTREILFSDARRLAQKAVEAEVEADLEIYEGMWHVWQLFAPTLPEGNKAIASIAKFVEKVRQKQAVSV
jgi:epsilon-lactone hydrolase